MKTGKPPYLPGLEPTAEEAAAIDAALSDVPEFKLPGKPTVTPREAAAALGVSERLVRYAIEDGTLLAVAANRDENTPIHRWRIVVRMDREITRDRRHGLTLCEWYEKRRNVREADCVNR